jgi:hypothetical protein
METFDKIHSSDIVVGAKYLNTNGNIAEVVKIAGKNCSMRTSTGVRYYCTKQEIIRAILRGKFQPLETDDCEEYAMQACDDDEMSNRFDTSGQELGPPSMNRLLIV